MNANEGSEMTYEELVRWWGYWTPAHHLSDYLDTNGGGREGGGVTDKTMADGDE